MNTSVRIEVPQNIYDQLVKLQEKQRQASGRKPALASLILGFCVNGLSNNEQTGKNEQNFALSGQKNVQNEQKSVQNRGYSEQNRVPDEQNPAVLASDARIERRLKRWDEYLLKWESDLREKEDLLKEKTVELLEQREELLLMKEDVLDSREKLRQEDLAGADRIVETKILNYELKNRDRKIGELEDSIRNMKNEHQRALKSVEHAAQKEVKPSFWDDIKQYWPLILGGLGLVVTALLSNKKNKSQSDSRIEKISGILNKLEPGDKKDLGNAILDFIQDYQQDKKGELPKDTK